MISAFCLIDDWLKDRPIRQQGPKPRFEFLSHMVPHDPLISIVDSFPMPVCRFARAKRCRIFAGQAASGYDEVARQTYYGLRAHVRICWPGVIVASTLAPANVHDTGAVRRIIVSRER